MHLYRGAALAALLTALGGCSTMIRHNDVLIFATTTQLGVTVSAAGTTTGSPGPNVDIGYKRTEAVWMPLIANADGTAWKPNACPPNTANCPPTLDELKYAGGGEQATAQHGTDSYSVLASFGAKVTGEAASGPKAGLGLAQFFATGIAAQRLASNAAVTQALSIQDPVSAQAGAAAAAVSSASKTESPEIVAAIAQGTVAAGADQTLATRATACINSKGTDAFAAKLPAGKPQTEVKSATSAPAMLHLIQKWSNNADIDAATTALCP